MKNFLQEKIEGAQFELLIDTQIFISDIILKAAYNFLDKGYFFFSLDENQNMILQFTKKEGILDTPQKVIGDFSDSLLETLLRNKIEKENQSIREVIVNKAINGPIDEASFVSLDTENNVSKQNEIDFDQDIDDILKEIENDPDLKINEDEIEKILKEIDEEANDEIGKPTISVDLNAIKQAKENFNK